jgi:hypothetical protein
MDPLLALVPSLLLLDLADLVLQTLDPLHQVLYQLVLLLHALLEEELLVSLLALVRLLHVLHLVLFLALVNGHHRLLGLHLLLTLNLLQAHACRLLSLPGAQLVVGLGGAIVILAEGVLDEVPVCSPLLAIGVVDDGLDVVLALLALLSLLFLRE